jgi:hypothetical protein
MNKNNLVTNIILAIIAVALIIIVILLVPRKNINHLIVDEKNQNIQAQNVQPVVVDKSSNDPQCSPSLTLISPNGGEVYRPGQQISVTWKSCNVRGNVSIILESPGHNFNGPWISDEIPNTGMATFMLPTFYSSSQEVSAQPGKFYKIRIASPSARVNQDYSDDFFTIQ